MHCNFLLQLKMAKCRHVLTQTCFNPFCPEKKEKKKKEKKQNSLWACSLQKVIKALTFSGHEKLSNSFYFKILDIVW